MAFTLNWRLWRSRFGIGSLSSPDIMQLPAELVSADASLPQQSTFCGVSRSCSLRIPVATNTSQSFSGSSHGPNVSASAKFSRTGVRIQGVAQLPARPNVHATRKAIRRDGCLLLPHYSTRAYRIDSSILGF